MIRDLASKSREAVQSRNLPECRQFLHSFVEKVLSHRDRVEIYFKIHVSYDTNVAFSQLRSEECKRALREEYKPVV